MPKLRVLIADDDAVFCRLTADFIRSQGYDVAHALDVESMQKLLKEQEFDLIMQDMCFPALQDGFQMLEEVHARFPDTPILMISGSGHIPDAVNAIKLGATDFIEKPISKEYLMIRLSRLSENLKIKRDYRELQISAIGILGNSAEMQKLYDAIIRAAKFDNPVLITGETGVGKELAASAIHRLSDKSSKSMVRINCASIPSELFEAELFGYEKGAFTGAQHSKTGYFEIAQNNSIFLDEIGELPLEVQPKLLRAISESEVQKLGGKVKQINTRLISASNQDLLKKMEEGSFRRDLYYRINSIHIHLPPLRERREDIIKLSEHFINDFCARNQMPPKLLAPDAANWLLQQKFPGNVRELKNLIERALVFGKSEQITVVDFTTKEEMKEKAG